MASDEASPPAERLRVVGAWSGALEVLLGVWTVPMLRAEVARRAGGVDPCRINLIFGGRVLRDDPPESLQQAGLKSNSKVLSSLTSPDRAKAIAAQAAAAAAEEEHTSRLTRLWDAAKALSQRHTDGSFPEEGFNVDLEDQSGQKVMFGSVDDIKAVKMALMLHQKAKTFIKRDKHKDALDVLMMAEEAFSLCDPKLIERVDNVPMLQLDIVWCYFVLHDVSCLELAGARLEKARSGFEHSHGKDSTRFRLLQAGHHADLAIYVRLELLEGVIAYHNGHTEKARESLNSAQVKYMQLQVPDEAISILMGMGYGARAAKRALKMTGYDIQSSVDLLCEERQKKIRRIQEDRETKKVIMEQRKYGKTPMNKAVDMQKLKFLVAIGFEKKLAAEALRINENDSDRALDLLTDPEQNCILQSKILSRALRSSRGSSAGSSSSSAAAATTASGVNNSQAQVNTSTNVPDGSAMAWSHAPSVMNEDAVNNGEATNNDEEDMEGDDANPPPVRDVVTENELAHELTGDVLDDYDIDVSNEGQAIAEYLSLLEPAVTS
ncbi:hypothetical protein GUJ93_ZPchr0004g39088 [Zizania palustris]|uniref:NEDD8 ultimate buster 1 n=1 Tax=Zizania palustris TaxID=103762 RepID=A0A8J5T3G3_ZIZPA|nr:hypothetical protein GUJ93_ZPchr0004g39088 [Zizania palustris]